MPNTLFTPFGEEANHYSLPEVFTSPFNYAPHPLALLAAEKLQHHLINQKEWMHNFGLSGKEDGEIIGKMFGVLVVTTQQNELGYLAAFSGKLAGGNHHTAFVPPVFDMLTEGSFLNNGMLELTRMNDEINVLVKSKSDKNTAHIILLKSARKKYSNALQNEIFDHYHFLNKLGEEKSLRDIFTTASYKNPPAGAGECAAPKLLQYAFKHHMKPIAMAEFWWGQSPKSTFWKHGNFYPSCKEKCEPILAHMLTDIDIDMPDKKY